MTHAPQPILTAANWLHEGPVDQRPPGTASEVADPLQNARSGTARSGLADANRARASLRDARTRSGLSMRDAARRAGCSAGHWSAVENGRVVASKAMLAAMATTVGLDDETTGRLVASGVGHAGWSSPWRNGEPRPRQAAAPAPVSTLPVDPLIARAVALVGVELPDVYESRRALARLAGALEAVERAARGAQ